VVEFTCQRCDRCSVDGRDEFGWVVDCTFL
jgi:hypothetical protein